MYFALEFQDFMTKLKARLSLFFEFGKVLGKKFINYKL